MQNLKLIDQFKTKHSEIKNADVICLNCDNQYLYCVSGQCLYSLSASGFQTAQVQEAINLYSVDEEPTDRSAVSVHYIPDESSICVTFSNGDIVNWNPLMSEPESMGQVDNGINAAQWSPDNQLLAIVTNALTLLVMTQNLEPLFEKGLLGDDKTEMNFVNVGWGKKETQFHGSEGKQAAHTVKVAPTASPHDDLRSRISWRGDCEYLAVSYLDPDTAVRCIQVWTREGVLYSRSEACPGLEHALAWKPSGSLIAAAVRGTVKYQVGFFEVNGLRHGELTLPYKASEEAVVRELAWNADSSVLGVWISVKTTSVVELWTTTNYHWYLKQTLTFPGLSSVCWDPEAAYVLHCMGAEGDHLRYRWTWDACTARKHTAETAVIDGNEVLVTPLGVQLVPPPLCSYALQLPLAVKEVRMSCVGDSCQLWVQLCDKSLWVFQCGQDVQYGPVTPEMSGVKVDVRAAGGNGFKVQCQLARLVAVIRPPDDVCHDPLTSLYHMTITSSNGVVFVSCDPPTLHLAQLSEGLQLSGWRQLPLDSRLLGVAYDRAISERLYVQTLEGALDIVHLDLLTCEKLFKKFPQACSNMSLCSFDGHAVALGLTETYRLFAEDKELANNCTSYIVHDEYLVLTTHLHTCRCLSRRNVLKDLSVELTTPRDETARPLERGSRIVTLPPGGTRLVLQMPRGNLEAIHPRALMISEIKLQLDSLDYARAFDSMRRHRINMNLLHDHNPEKFLSNLSKFIEQVPDANLLNIFIADLSELDISRRMYRESYLDRQIVDIPRKVDIACEKLRSALEAAGHKKYFLAILTTYVKLQTPDVQTALMKIKEMKDSGDKKTAEQGLLHLMLMVDVEELYKEALGTYDFDLVLLVAEKSHKDPKEFLPFLNNLKQKDELYRKYCTDHHLKRYGKALVHISQCGCEHFEELLTLVREQRLYRQALTLFHPTSEQYKSVAGCYGDYLSQKRHWQEAGLMYWKAGQLPQALDSLKQAGDWRLCLVAGGAMDYTEAQIRELSAQLANSLVQKDNHRDAAILYEQYIGDHEEAISCLVKCHEWTEALRMMHKYKRTDFLETDLKPALEEQVDLAVESITENSELFQNYTSRLRAVRKRKKTQQLDYDDNVRNRPDGDLYSDTSSAAGDSVVSEGHGSRTGQSRKTGSIISKASGSSRKSQRKAGNKSKWSLREGSQHEDLALVEALAKLIEQAESFKGTVGALLPTLVMFNYDHKATHLQQVLTDYIALMDKSTPEIWSADEDSTTHSNMYFGPQSTANSLAQRMMQDEFPRKLDPVLLQPPITKKNEQWKLVSIS